jgi:hypothetical protein
MKTRHRFVALLALVAVMWTTLWPLVSASHALAMSEPMPLCHQAGMMVAPDEAPTHSPQAPRSDGKTHCPLCIMAFYASFATPIAEPQFHFIGRSVAFDVYAAPLRHRVAAYLPESRAPPALLTD